MFAMEEPAWHPSRKPRFKVGDRVHIVGPTVAPREITLGIVTEVIASPAVPIFRYRVTFDDNTVDTFFGFELEPIENQES
jgi:hypothetical protein